jgi:hypothetical protein
LLKHCPFFVILPSCPTSTLIQRPGCFDYCSFIISFAIRKYKSSNLVLFQACVGCLGPFHFHVNCKDWLINVLRKPAGILIGISLTLKISMRTIATLTLLIFLIHRPGMTFHLFRFSLVMLCNFQNTCLTHMFNLSLSIFWRCS